MFDYLNVIQLPNVKILPSGVVSRAVLETGVLTLWEAIAYIKQLPYERTTDRENYLQVITEKRGACSTKHALIAALAQELSIPLTLKLGIFFLTNKTHTAVANILKQYSLEAIPEAHCFLTYGQHTLDITFPDCLDLAVDVEMKWTINITPQQIGAFKLEKHREFIKQWIINQPHLKFDLIWEAREKCIQQLSNHFDSNLAPVT